METPPLPLPRVDGPRPPFETVQRWYAAQCDGDWEHGWGVRIETLDNPGWMIRISLTDTDLGDAPFDAVRVLDEHGHDWMDCQVRDGSFQGACGPWMLDAVLRVFLDWARLHDAWARERGVWPGGSD